MIAFWLFLGFAFGVACAILVGLAIINHPVPEREQPIVSMIGSGHAKTTGPETLYGGINRRLL
jgi:hypothetical protein